MNQLKIPAQVSRLDDVQDFVAEIMEKNGVPGPKQIEIAVVVEEIFVNIAHYAYAPDEGEAEITAEAEADRLTLVFKDRGSAYNPLERDDPDINLSLEEREIGGLGIFMVKKMMDDVFYDYRDGQNILTVVKQLP